MSIWIFIARQLVSIWTCCHLKAATPARLNQLHTQGGFSAAALLPMLPSCSLMFIQAMGRKVAENTDSVWNSGTSRMPASIELSITLVVCGTAGVRVRWCVHLFLEYVTVSLTWSELIAHSSFSSTATSVTTSGHDSRALRRLKIENYSNDDAEHTFNVVLIIFYIPIRSTYPI